MGNSLSMGNLQYKNFCCDHFFRVVVYLYTPLFRYTCTPPPCTGIHVYMYTPPVQVYMYTPPLHRYTCTPTHCTGIPVRPPPVQV